MAAGRQLQGSAADRLIVVGAVETTAVQLKAGWNLVAFLSFRTGYTVANLRTDTGNLATIVQGYSATGPYNLVTLADADSLVTGQGYWVYANQDTTWTVSVT